MVNRRNTDRDLDYSAKKSECLRNEGLALIVEIHAAKNLIWETRLGINIFLDRYNKLLNQEIISFIFTKATHYAKQQILLTHTSYNHLCLVSLT